MITVRGRELSTTVLLLALAGLVSACKKPTAERSEPAPPRHDALLRALTPALRVVAADLDGDRRPEVTAVDAQFIRVLDLDGKIVGEARAPSGIQLLGAGDVDGDGRAELLTGWGATADRRAGRARLSVFRLAGGKLSEDLLLEPQTERQDVAAILPHAGVLVLAWFESKYMVRIETARRENSGWTRSELATIRMATSFGSGDVDADGKADLIVGRTYGDTIEADGDAFVLQPDGQRRPIPVVGGVRSLAVADLDRNGRAEVLLGDGWNRDYGKLARGQLTKASLAAKQAAFAVERLDDGAGQYTLDQIFTADLDGDGRAEIVTRGNAFVRVLRQRDGRWRAETVGTDCRTALALELDTRPGLELFTLCEDGPQIRKP